MLITTNEVKQKLIESLNLEDLTPDDIDDNTPLFNEGLGLDSVDAIELIVALDTAYNIKFENMNELKEIFANISNLTDYINKNLKR
ncbi:phosphopantetheine-binding protein [Thermococcus sp.]|uniref:phosphopantetheine-binding protein n=1 Tax=Thermococcus sp. TaxID=35749 RepID=UPI002638BE9D|nr:phosphopantetheine-binding protein [Thermococcus sp.]